MLNTLLYILWNPNLEIFRMGSFAIRWYATCWLVGLGLAYLMVQWLYKHQKIKPELFDPLFTYCFIGILVGARLGHCLFYQPDYYLSSLQHIVEMFFPIHFMNDGNWRFTGYEGLASHGGTIGLIVALILYVRKTKLGLWTVLDNIAIATPITATFIRLGNLMNSEIIGTPTNVPWAFIFERVDMIPRHPGQLYEAIAYFFFFFIILHFYCKTNKKVGTGFYFGLCLTLIFTFRFFIEYIKDIQVSFESGMLFNMGQLLSIPFIVLGITCMSRKNTDKYRQRQ